MRQNRIRELTAGSPGLFCQLDTLERQCHLVRERCEDPFLFMGYDALRFGWLHAEDPENPR